MRRREFIEALPLATGACWLEGVAQTCFSAGTNPSCVLVKNSTAPELTRKAIEMLGGMSRFVKPGQTIVIKPNMSWDRPPRNGRKYESRRSGGSGQDVRGSKCQSRHGV
jgi:hypothetical protein